MQGSKKPPASDAAAESPKSDWRSERNTAPPSGLPPRRDDRAEPDDESASSSRVDVVNVDGGGSRDIAATGMVTLRRELAKLHQQAAAVEKSLEDQRRDRSDSLDRLERATERVLFLEARLTSAEAETGLIRKTNDASLADLKAVRGERDDLARGVEAAKALTAELAKVKAELEQARASEANVARSEVELAKLREEAARAATEAKQAKADADKLREAVKVAEGDAAMVGEQASKIRQEAAKDTEELTKLRDEIVRAREDNARDRATARERIDLIERALDDARAMTARTETELEAARSNEERLGRQLEAALESASRAESRASNTAMAHAALDVSVRRLREEIAGAFARVGSTGAGATYTSAQLVSPPAEVPPPESAAFAPVAAARISMPPPTYASVPPQLHDDGWGSVPPPAPGSVPPAAAQGSVRPSEHGSMPPTTRGSRLPIPMGTIPPEAKGSVPPTAEDLVLQAHARQELLAKLVDPNHAEEAAVELVQHPEWLHGAPPPALVAALSSVDYNADGAIFDLARAWEREPLCHGLIAALRSESELRLREHAAWLLKHLAAPSSWKIIVDLAKSEEETVQLRRWLLEGLDRLAAGRAIGWVELGDVVTVVARHSDASLRDGVVGILLSLERSDEKGRLLLEILRSDDDEGVLASAVNALASVLPMELDQAVITRLLEHPSARVQRSVRDLIERAKHVKS